METGRHGDKEFLAEPSGKAERRTLLQVQTSKYRTYVLNSLNSLFTCVLE